MRGLLSLMLAIPLAVGCGDDGGDDKPSDAESFEGSEPGDCTDLADNDMDGLFDCDDDGCAGSPECEESDEDGGTEDGGTEDGGTEDGGTEDGGTEDDGSEDGGTEDGGTEDGGTEDGGTEDTGTDDTGTDDTGTDDTGTDDTGTPAGTDEDGDGITLEAGDCDDADATIYPGAAEVWGDGIDQDCDGVADVEGSSCSADLTVTFPDGSTTTLDGCTDWDFDATFEYDPDDPPEVTSFTFTLGATTEAEFDCRIELVQEGVCGPGYYDERDDSTTTTAVLMDCSGVADEYESTFTSHEGYLRVDTIEAGTEAGSFSGDPLPTTLEGHLHVWTPEGIDIQGDLALTLVQLAGDSEEESECLVSTGDQDEDGFTGQNFDGNDCDDSDADTFPGATEIIDDGIDQNCNGNDEVTCSGSFNIVDDSSAISELRYCAIVLGSITINNNDLLTNVDELSSLTMMPDGGLSIYANPALTNLDGLANLTTVGDDHDHGSFRIVNNDSLDNVDGLASLTQVYGDLSITGNPILLNINGLSGLTQVGGNLQVSGADLTSVGLPNLSTVEGHLTISDNPELTSIDLPSLSTLEGQLEINNNSALANIDGMNDLTAVRGISISACSEITDVDALSHVTSVGESLKVTYNESLTNLDGLESITSIGSYVPGELEISGNSVLCQSVVDAFASRFDTIFGSIWIVGNDESC